MDYDLWKILSWIYLLADIIGFGIVANWPFQAGKKYLMGFFGIHIVCSVLPTIAERMNLIQKINDLFPFHPHSFYIIINLLRFMAMILLLLGLMELGKKVSSKSSPKNDWENF